MEPRLRHWGAVLTEDREAESTSGIRAFLEREIADTRVFADKLYRESAKSGFGRQLSLPIEERPHVASAQ